MQKKKQFFALLKITQEKGILLPFFKTCRKKGVFARLQNLRRVALLPLFVRDQGDDCTDDKIGGSLKVAMTISILGNAAEYEVSDN